MSAASRSSLTNIDLPSYKIVIPSFKITINKKRDNLPELKPYKAPAYTRIHPHAHLLNHLSPSCLSHETKS